MINHGNTRKHERKSRHYCISEREKKQCELLFVFRVFRVFVVSKAFAWRMAGFFRFHLCLQVYYETMPLARGRAGVTGSFESEASSEETEADGRSRGTPSWSGGFLGGR